MYEYIFSFLAALSVLVFFSLPFIKRYIAKKVLLPSTSIEITNNFFLITFPNGESILAPYNEDLIYDERKIKIDVNGKKKNIKLKRGFDLSKLNLIELKN